MFLNMKLLAQHTLNGFGGMGEGMSMQLARDGRRVLWLAHESAPKNFTAVDVSDPRAPKLVIQTELPHARVRSNSLDIVGDMMVVAVLRQLRHTDIVAKFPKLAALVARGEARPAFQRALTDQLAVFREHQPEGEAA